MILIFFWKIIIHLVNVKADPSANRNSEESVYCFMARYQTWISELEFFWVLWICSTTHVPNYSKSSYQFVPNLFSMWSFNLISYVKCSLWCCSPQFPCVLQMWSLIWSQWYTLAKCSLCCSHSSHVSMNFIPFALPNVSCSSSAHVSSKHVPYLIQMFCHMFPMFYCVPHVVPTKFHYWV
jgi:hypothetical protein